jgi:5'-nucleotidase
MRLFRLRFDLALAVLLPFVFEIEGATAGETETLTLLTTNDVHGAMERLPEFGAIVAAHRTALGGRLLLLDAGDQFQGTLLSNFDEGQALFDLYSRLGYTAVVPGNHDYDFGPVGWLEDQPRRAGLSPDSAEGPRGALLRLVRSASFPLLSANTWLKGRFFDVTGSPVSSELIQSGGCAVSPSTLPLDFTRATRPDFLQASRIVTLPSGIRVGLFGLDHPRTASMTTAANVSDLCFENELSAALRILDELEPLTDLRILLLHGGDTPQDRAASLLTEQILAARPGSLHAVVAGHTHHTHLHWIQGVPVLQSGANGETFGRIDLKIDLEKRALVPESIRAQAGIPISSQKCPEGNLPFEDGGCTLSESGVPRWQGVPAVVAPEIEAPLSRARENLRPLALRPLGEILQGPLTRNRIGESPLTNLLTDELRILSGAPLSFLNTGGIRADLPQGALNYEAFFEVLPFNNHAVLAGPLPWPKLRRLLERSIQTCGQFGALIPSGLRVVFSKDCGGREGIPARTLDPQATLERVTLAATGEVLWDRKTGKEAPADRGFTIATLDFLLAGGSGFTEFAGTPMLVDLGLFRELLVQRWERKPLRVRGPQLLDGRWSFKPQSLNSSASTRGTPPSP